MRHTVYVSLLILLGAADATARSLEAIRVRGALTLCAHPNALPFASKRDADPGFQVEIGRALAKQLAVSLDQRWVVNSFQYRRADCDIVLDAIADPAALAEVGLRMSRPYQRSGVTLAVGAKSSVASLTDLRPGQRVGVQVGSIASMMLSKRGVQTSPFGFEDEIMDALAKGEIDAAAVTPAAIGWFNQAHPDARVRRIPAFEDGARLRGGMGSRESNGDLCATVGYSSHLLMHSVSRGNASTFMRSRSDDAFGQRKRRGRWIVVDHMSIGSRIGRPVEIHGSIM